MARELSHGALHNKIALMRRARQVGSHTGLFYVLALFSAGIGSALAFMMYPDVGIYVPEWTFRLVIVLSAGLTLLFLICATANLWFRR